MIKQFFSAIVGLCLLSTNVDAQKAISLEDIWQNYTFSTNKIAGFEFQIDGKHYTRLEGNAINQYDLTTGQLTSTILNGATLFEEANFNGTISAYEFSQDEQKIIIATELERIYRHSKKGHYYIWDGTSLTKLFEGDKQMYATFNPQGNKVAFVVNNNLYYTDLSNNQVVQITSDGHFNHIINGALDWVYEEEFSFKKGFQWAPDGQKIAFYRFDETEVPLMTMTKYTNQSYPAYHTFKYPKVGEKNSVVEILIYDLNKKKTVKASIGKNQDQYIPRIKWSKNPNELCIYQLNRHQNHLKLLMTNANNGKSRVLLEERNPWYISEKVLDNLTFLDNNREFIWTSEKDGWHHFYLYDLRGNELRQLTSGNWDVDQFYGVDEKNAQIYFQASKISPMQREIYVTDLKGNKPKKISRQKGWNSAQFSSTFDYFVNTTSTINHPTSAKVHDRKGEMIRVIEDNEHVSQLQKAYGTTPVEFFNFKTRDNLQLNGWLIKPADFDENKEYPLFMYLYGGPGSQKVVDRWTGQNYWWFQMLAQQGYIVACVDNRGTGGRGQAFKKSTYKQLGYYETMDQIDAAKYLGSKQFVDENRIGIFGWSYGGYMSSLCLLKGNDIFKAAIAVAPVTNWKWYDTVYTERFMRTEEENPEGYSNNSPINVADRLKGNFLLVHGGGDDNVHFQNSAELMNALIAANKQFDTFYYPNRNHSIYGGNTRMHLYQRMTNFLNDKLKNDKRPMKGLKGNP